MDASRKLAILERILLVHQGISEGCRGFSDLVAAAQGRLDKSG